MRCLFRRTGVGIVILASLVLGARAAERDNDAWQHDFDRAETDARQQGLPLLVHFHAKWCGPCKQMDAEVLHDPVVQKQLRSGFVAVKVDGDERPDLVRRFQIEVFPTDVFLDPNGYLMERSARSCDRSSYLALVSRVASRFSQSRKALVASQSKPSSTEPTTAPAGIDPQTPINPLVAPSPIRSSAANGANSTSPPLVATRSSQSPSSALTIAPQKAAVTATRTVGLRGYSPVALVNQRRWVLGNEKLVGEYKGIVYRLASVEELKRFKESPDRYAPQVLGCDPVILDVTDRAVAGDIRFAAFFESELYLFVSDKSRQTFRQDPERFIRTKHVLKDDELDDKRLR